MIPLLLISSLLGCKRAPPQAPRDLEDLCRYLYREWPNDDPEVMSQGIGNLRDFIGNLDLDVNVNDRSYLLAPPSVDDLADVDRPQGRDPADLIGVGVARQSVWPVNDHSRVQIRTNQLPLEPTAKRYKRSFPDQDDPTCLPQHDCAALYSFNEVRRENFLMSVSFELYKDFRWVALPDNDAEHALISRSYTDQVWRGDSGNTAIYQSFSLDVWVPDHQGTTWRWQVVWSESDVGVSDENLIAGTIKAATDDILKTGDEVIEELLH